jgi:hypothetical protein
MPITPKYKKYWEPITNLNEWLEALSIVRVIRYLPAKHNRVRFSLQISVIVIGYCDV